MKRRRTRFIAVVMCVMLVVTIVATILQGPMYAYADIHTHHFDETTHICNCGAHDECVKSTPHEGWTVLTMDILAGTVNYTSAGGFLSTFYDLDMLSNKTSEMFFYLDSDITLEYPILWDVSGYTLNLCLNGHLLNGGGKDAFYVTGNGSVLNLIDCGNDAKYFTDSDDDGCFETLESTYDTTGKTEGKDYVCIYGGAVFNADEVFEISNSSIVNIIGTSVVGCDSRCYTAHVAGTPSLFNVINSRFTGNYTKTSIINNQEEVVVSDGSTIEYNRSGRSILDNDTDNKLTLSDCVIKNNKIVEVESFLNYAVACWDNELVMEGKVIITDNILYRTGNYPNGEYEQRNLCFVDSGLNSIPFDCNGLESGSLIGISLNNSLEATENAVACENNTLPAASYFSDNPMYYIKEDNNNILLVNRLSGQPDSENNFTCTVNCDDGATIDFQWYNADYQIKYLTDDNTEEIDLAELDMGTKKGKGTYNGADWTPCELERGCWGLFADSIESGWTLKCDPVFSQNVNPGNFVIACINIENMTYDYFFMQRDKSYSFDLKNEAVYALMMQCYDDATVDDLKLEHVRLEKVNPGDKIDDQITSSLTCTDSAGSYACKITVTDNRGMKSSLFSNVVTITAAEVSAAPTANTIIYDSTAQELVTAGTAENGTLKYALGTDGTTEPSSGWSTDIPTGTDAGTYYVWYKAFGNTGYPDSEACCVTADIGRKDVAGATVGKFDAMTYAGSAQTPSATVTVDNLQATGTWSPVTNVSDTTTFTADGNFTGTIKDLATGMGKSTPAAPSGLSGVNATGKNREDGKITGTAASMEYSQTTDFATANDCTEAETTGLLAGTYYVRYKETENANVSPYTSVTVSDIENFNITITDYDDVYDGKAHGLTLSGVPDGAVVKYGTVEGTYDRDSIGYTDFTDGEKTVYVSITKEGYNDYYGSGTINISQKDVKGAEIGKFDSMTYSGQEQTPSASVTIEGLAATGTWSPVTNVSDTTTFTADGNFTGTIKDLATGMGKSTPAAPSGLSGVNATGKNREDGKITGTAASMEYSQTTDFATANDCTEAETTGLLAGTYYVRYEETENANASPYTSVTVSDIENFNITITDYDDVYDGKAHGLTLSGVPDGAVVKYGTVEGTYDRDSIGYTDFTDGEKTVYVSVTKEGYNDYYGSGTINISQKDVKGAEIGKFDSMTYSGQEQTPSASVTIEGLAATGTWSPVTNVSDTTTFTADGNFTGTIADLETGMAKLTPAAPTGLSGVKPGAYGKNDGRITGTSVEMEYSTISYFTTSKDCQGTEISNLSAGSYYIRYRETPNTNASAFVTVIVYDGDRDNNGGGNNNEDPDDEDNPAEEKYTIPVRGEDTVQVEADIKKGNADVKEIKDSDIEAIFENSSTEKKTTVTVDLSGTKQKVTSVTLSKKSVENITEAVKNGSTPVEKLEIKLSKAAMLIDSQAVEAINEQAKGDEIKLVVRDNDTSSLNAAQQKALKNTEVVGAIDAHIECNGKEIHDFRGGSVQVSFEFKLEAGKNPNHYFVRYINYDGSTEDFHTMFINNVMVFVTTHFSDYVIVYDETKENDTNKATTDEKKAADIPYLQMAKVIGLGNKFNLNITNISDDADVKFTSSDKDIATVDKNGVITAVGIGKCKVKGVIKQNGSTYRFTIVVYVKET